MKIKENPNLTQDDIARIYNELFKKQGQLRDSDAYYHWVLDRLAPIAGSRLLDVACGEGLLVEAARNRGVNGIGIDLSSLGTMLAHKRLGTSLVSRANGEILPFADQSFDYVTNTGSLEHFIDPSAGVSEMIRVLKPNGQAAVVLPNSYYLVDIIWQVWRTGYSASHKQPLERFASFREWWDFLEDRGLRVGKAYKYNFCFPRSKADLLWYRQHPRKILNLCLAPFIPYNFSNHFLYICSRK
jgi:ubiquinone/menaquinone biosynthesis C-methylase UbiE